MKKIVGVIVAFAFCAALSGCYSKSCDQLAVGAYKAERVEYVKGAG